MFQLMEVYPTAEVPAYNARTAKENLSVSAFTQLNYAVNGQVATGERNPDATAFVITVLEGNR